MLGQHGQPAELDFDRYGESCGELETKAKPDPTEHGALNRTDSENSRANLTVMKLQCKEAFSTSLGVVLITVY